MGSKTPYEEGYEYSVRGRPLSNNPYKIDSPEYVEWRKGWQDKYYGDINGTLRKES
jgi:hypothetical protein